MKEEADKLNMSQKDRVGFIIFDEMSVQEDLESVRDGHGLRLEGFTDMGTESEQLRVMKTESSDSVLATHALQFIFVAPNGFR